VSYNHFIIFSFVKIDTNKKNGFSTTLILFPILLFDDLMESDFLSSSLFQLNDEKLICSFKH